MCCDASKFLLVDADEFKLNYANGILQSLGNVNKKKHLIYALVNILLW